jgi:hypothetical protein
MKRREFLGYSAMVSFLMGHISWSKVARAEGKKLTEKDILKEGQPATIANYCQNPEKQPNKFCPGWPTNKGHCETCTFYNKDNSESDFKGKKYARCQLLSDPSKPQFVSKGGWCATYVKKP